MFVRLLPVLLLLAPAAFGAGELDRARQQFARAEYREAIRTLAPAVSTGDPAVYELTGRSWFMLAEYKKAQESFEKAVGLSPGNSTCHHWLGKAYGRRAETSNPISAPLLASKARQSFERAVELDPKNIEAINDLFSYYMEAPGFLGGGVDKAEKLAEKIRALDPVEYHYALAKIAEKRKDVRTAEHHFRQAFEMAPKSVGRAVDLARFLASHGRLQESDAIFAQAEKIAPNAPRLLFEKASALVKAKKNLPEARSLLERYLRAPLTPDDPPRSEAERLLKQAAQLGA
jgi:tetratricopeptide (TPR) repeat protein